MHKTTDSFGRPDSNRH